MRSTKSSKFFQSVSRVFLLGALFAGCQSSAHCVYGDRIECRCGDAASSPYGYQQCSEQQRFEGPCRCDGVPQGDAGVSGEAGADAP